MRGSDKAGAARHSVMRGDPPIVLICSASVDVLSNCSRDFVRALRSEGVRVEFHTPGNADGILQSTNRLLEGIPLEGILSSTELFPPHLLIIDDAETISAGETTALRRIVQGLRGSAFRVLLLAKRSRSEAGRLPLADLNDLMMIWDADGVESETLAIKPDPAAAVENKPLESDAPEIEPPKKTATSIKSLSKDPLDVKIPDVLSDLARERAETRGFDVTFSRRWITRPLTIATVVAAVIFSGYLLTSGMTASGTTEPVVYDCGSHPDRESIDVLLTRIGRSTPTRVTAESGRLRLQLGPFPSEEAAKVVREQAWLIGACRVNPITVRALESLTRKTGG
jgi:hypothetical protein